MKTYIFVLTTFSLLLYNCNSTTTTKIAALKPQSKTFTIQSFSRIIVKRVKAKYDTLIPIFDGLFITYHQIDSIHYSDHLKKMTTDDGEYFIPDKFTTNKAKKWGVIDSLGKVIVPFICDGVKEISDHKGIASVFSTSFSLNTGIPRYKYFGNYYFFDTSGVLTETKKEFDLTITFIADFHDAEFVIQQGPEFYLPTEYRKVIQ